MDSKKCYKCGQVKSMDDFYSNKSKYDGKGSECKFCSNLIAKQWAKDNKEKSNVIKDRWLKDNPEKRKEVNARWRTDNHEKMMQLVKDWQKRNSEITKIRKRVGIALRGYAKSAPTWELLGCSKDEFRNHLEQLFTEGMTWQKVMNSEIHIDHVVPCSAFDMSKPEHQRLCFHYSNLQPLWASDNARKYNKMPHEHNG